MTDSSSGPNKLRVALRVLGEPVEVEAPRPEGPVRLDETLPFLRNLADRVIEVAVRRAETDGSPVSCRQGCAACCKIGPVPVTPPEAYALARVVEAMPEPRRTEIRGRFADRARRLRQAGLADLFFQHDHALTKDEAQKIARLGLACPFLEGNDCSIYFERPLACRECLVTSPAALCDDPFTNPVKYLPLPIASVGASLKTAEKNLGRPQSAVPLVLALEYVEIWRNELERTHSAPELFQSLLQTALGSTNEPPPPAPAMEMDKTETATIHLRVPAGERTFAVPMPAERSTLLDLLPAAREMAGQTTALALEQARSQGREISCRAGCGACCRQLVAISVVEAQSLAEVVDAMPADRQAIVRQRFADAVQRLEKAGLLDPDEPPGERALVAPNQGSREATLQALGRAYFQQKIPCPFLENESCGIYEQRPTVCREYHVTTPAENCTKLYQVEVERVDPAVRMVEVLARTTDRTEGIGVVTIPLVLSLEWSKAFGTTVKKVQDGKALFRTMMEEFKAY